MPTEGTIKINELLSPLSFLYGIGVRIRNFLFNIGLLSSKQYPIPVICIGNLAVGGTGKTPHTEYIIRLLESKYKIAVLSRGYKRKTSGYILATTNSTSQEIGDEPFQMKQKFPNILVAVDSKRTRGIDNLLALPESKRPDIILLDDAFQHRYVSPSFSIVLTDYNRLYYYDKLLPAGFLREPAYGIHRADAVIVTKCDEMKPIEYRIIEENMKLLAHQELFFTRIVYKEIQPVFSSETSAKTKNEIKKDDEILVLSGIASPLPFIEEIKKYTDKVTPITFADHHDFNRQDIRKIKSAFDKLTSPEKFILCTEKDAARFKSNPFFPEEWKDKLYYMPITIEFCIHKKDQFDNMINKHIITIQRNNILR